MPPRALAAATCVGSRTRAVRGAPAARGARRGARRCARCGAGGASEYWAPYAHLGSAAAAAICEQQGLDTRDSCASRVAQLQALLPEANCVVMACREPEAMLAQSTTAVAMQLASVSAACPEGTDVTRLVEWQPGILAGDKGGRAIGAAVAALRGGPEDRDSVLHGEALAVRAVWEAMGGADMGVERHEVVCQLCERWSMAETQGIHWEMLREHFIPQPLPHKPRSVWKEALGALAAAVRQGFGREGQWDPRETYKEGEGFGDFEKKRGY